MGHDQKVSERKIGWVLFGAFGISIFVIKRYLSPFIFDTFKDEFNSFFERMIGFIFYVILKKYLWPFGGFKVSQDMYTEKT